jgi:hypothetical protein
MTWNDRASSTAPLSRLDIARTDPRWSTVPEAGARRVDRDEGRELHSKGKPRERPVRPAESARAAEGALRA